ncbi:MAG: hypothetical protein AAGC68_09370 [Verrucomicrobiota bacterium]
MVQKPDSTPAFAELHEACQEERPMIADWRISPMLPLSLPSPFIAADPLHSDESISVPFRIETESIETVSERDVFHRRPCRFLDPTLDHSSAIGIDPSIAGVIVDQVMSLGDHYRK